MAKKTGPYTRGATTSPDPAYRGASKPRGRQWYCAYCKHAVPQQCDGRSCR